jgi:hypothetical protein
VCKNARAQLGINLERYASDSPNWITTPLQLSLWFAMYVSELHPRVLYSP